MSSYPGSPGAESTRSGKLLILAPCSAGHWLRNATVGGSRDARTAGSGPATAPIRTAEAMPPAHASTGIATDQPFDPAYTAVAATPATTPTTPPTVASRIDSARNCVRICALSHRARDEGRSPNGAREPR